MRKKKVPRPASMDVARLTFLGVGFRGKASP
jgi:hypothetical protein